MAQLLPISTLSSMMTRPTWLIRTRPLGPGTKPKPGPPMATWKAMVTPLPIRAWLMEELAPMVTSAPMLTPSSITTLAPMRQPGPMLTFSPITAPAAMAVPSPILALAATKARA